MSTPDIAPPSAAAADLATCDREPIRVPGTIQPHGLLLVLAPADLSVIQVSANTDQYLGLPHHQVLGRPVDQIFGAALAESLRTVPDGHWQAREPILLRTVRLPNRPTPLNAIAHRADGDVIVVELESATGDEHTAFLNLYPLVRTFVGRMQQAPDVAALCQLAADEVRRVTGFDRCLVYRFDEQWHGTTVAESLEPGAFDPLIGLRFPASDIPAQARELYRLNRIRLIADATYAPVPVLPAANPVTGGPLDMTYAALRSVSPVHVEYMRNMGTAASMSVSILRQGRLWGLISCHHRTPRAPTFDVRSACDFLGQVLAVQLDGRERAAEYDRRTRLREVHGKLLAYMASSDHFAQALVDHAGDLLALTVAAGAAVIAEGRVRLVGQTPPEADVDRIMDWLGREHPGDDVFATDSLAEHLPGAADVAATASGLLAIWISKLHSSYILWFRPEVVRTVTWGGDPRKPVLPAGSPDRLHPRKSFEAWKETVRLRSAAWQPEEREAAADLRNAIVGIVLRKAEELAELTAELERSNRELEAFSYSVSHDLRAPFRHIVGYAELLRDSLVTHPATAAEPAASAEARYVDTIIESARYAGTLVDNLLSFSQMGRASLTITAVDTARVIDEARRRLLDNAEHGRTIEWIIPPGLPTVRADLMMLRLVWENLLSNAIKYTRGRDPAVIQITADRQGGEWVFSVADNGIGFDMRYADKLFGVFQRLHRMEDFEGTGIGLANVRRIVGRHGGRTWADGRVDHGATFYFTLPTDAPSGVERV